MNIPLKPNTKLNRYSIVKHLTNGGMGCVYLARDDFNKPIVIKEYLPYNLNLRKKGERVFIFNQNETAMFEKGMQDFFDESEVLATIHNENIVSVTDSFKLNNTAYSVMEYIHGQSLMSFLQYGKGLKESFIQRIFIDVFQGVDWLHKNGIIHLDLKPSNIYITHTGKAVILDFGTAWLMNKAKSTTPMRTEGFAPPEQYKKYFKPFKIKQATDIYALGATLRSCISAKPPLSSIKRIDNGDWEKAENYWAGEYSNWLLYAIDEMTVLEWNKRPQQLKEIITLFKTMPNENLSKPLENHINKILSRTRNIK